MSWPESLGDVLPDCPAAIARRSVREGLRAADSVGKRKRAVIAQSAPWTLEEERALVEAAAAHGGHDWTRIKETAGLDRPVFEIFSHFQQVPRQYLSMRPR